MLSETDRPDDSGKSRPAGKKIIQILILFLLVSQTIFSQWYQLPMITTNWLGASSFSDIHNGMLLVVKEQFYEQQMAD